VSAKQDELRWHEEACQDFRSLVDGIDGAIRSAG
jgi:hypothetical protein